MSELSFCPVLFCGWGGGRGQRVGDKSGYMVCAWEVGRRMYCDIQILSSIPLHNPELLRLHGASDCHYDLSPDNDKFLDPLPPARPSRYFDVTSSRTVPP